MKQVEEKKCIWRTFNSRSNFFPKYI